MNPTPTLPYQRSTTHPIVGSVVMREGVKIKRHIWVLHEEGKQGILWAGDLKKYCDSDLDPTLSHEVLWSRCSLHGRPPYLKRWWKKVVYDPSWYSGRLETMYVIPGYFLLGFLFVCVCGGYGLMVFLGLCLRFL